MSQSSTRIRYPAKKFEINQQSSDGESEIQSVKDGKIIAYEDQHNAQMQTMT